MIHSPKMECEFGTPCLILTIQVIQRVQVDEITPLFGSSSNGLLIGFSLAQNGEQTYPKR